VPEGQDRHHIMIQRYEVQGIGSRIGDDKQRSPVVRRQSVNKNFHGIDTPAEVPITKMPLVTMGFRSVVSSRYASGNAADPIPLELFEIALRAKKAF